MSIVPFFLFSFIAISLAHENLGSVLELEVTRRKNFQSKSKCCVQKFDLPDEPCVFPSYVSKVDPYFSSNLYFHGHFHFRDEGKHRLRGDCTVSMKHNFVFTHVLKAGGSALKNWLVAVLCDGEKKRLGDFYPSPAEACSLDVLYQTNCLYIPTDNNLFSFAFVRNPVDRAVSQYAMAIHSDFLRGDPPTFEQFINEGPGTLELPVSHLSSTHYNTQSSFLFDGDGCPMVDFIGKVETMERDMLYILTVLDIPELWKGYERYGFRGHIGKDPNLFGTKYKAKNAVKFTEEMKRNFVERNAVDFENFGYEFPLMYTADHHEDPFTASYTEESSETKRFRRSRHSTWDGVEDRPRSKRKNFMKR